ncbi:MAG: IS4 family transposase, partial [Rhodospirillales bacterium]
LGLDASLYTLLQIFSLTLFEKMPIHQALAAEADRSDGPQKINQLELFAF